MPLRIYTDFSLFFRQIQKWKASHAKMKLQMTQKLRRIGHTGLEKVKIPLQAVSTINKEEDLEANMVAGLEAVTIDEIQR